MPQLRMSFGRPRTRCWIGSWCGRAHHRSRHRWECVRLIDSSAGADKQVRTKRWERRTVCELRGLAKAEHRTDNIADALDDWAKKIGELAAMILEHHSSCLLKLVAAREPETEAPDT
jgi:hypothetical protein